MAVSFPTSPSSGDTFNVGRVKYEWSGSAWKQVSSQPVSTGAEIPLTRSDGTTSDPIKLASIVIGDALVNDTTPQLGGDLDINGNDIVSDSDNEDINITPHGTGSVVLSNEVEIAPNVLQPIANDGAALGTGSLKWSDLFLADGAVINFSNGGMTLTHSATFGQDTLAVAGGILDATAIKENGTALTSTYSPLAGSGSIATVGTVTTGVWQGTDVAVAHGGTGASDASTARSNLGITDSGHTIQEEGSDLTARSNLNFVGAAVTATDNPFGDTTTVTIASTTPGGSDTQVQYNNSGAFGGSANLTYDGSVLKVRRDDTAISQTLEIEQDGTGDAAIQFHLTGVQGWYAGIDNSASDLFYINTGAGNAGNGINITTAGAVTCSGGFGFGGTTLTGTAANLNTLTDNSMADTLHRHSEIVASDGSPDPILTCNANGIVNITNNPWGSYNLDIFAGSTSHPQRNHFDGVAPDNNVYTFLYCSDYVFPSHTARCIIYSDGDLANHDGTYGTLSDQRLKQDIVDMRSYWDDFASLTYRKFRHKTDVAIDENAPYRLGLVAQEVSPIFPSLAVESPCLDPEDPEGPSTWWVKSSVIEGPIMASVVQELQTRLEAAEAKIAALESA
jgi:hypothetical protein